MAANEGDRADALLRHAKTNEWLDADPVDPVSQFPKGNPAVLQVPSSEFMTDLLNTVELFQMNTVKMSSAYSGRKRDMLLKEVAKARKSFFKYDRDNKMPNYKWLKYHNRLMALTLDHYIRSIRATTGLENKEKTLFAAETSDLAPMAVNPLERDKRRLSSLASSVVTDNMFKEDPRSPDNLFIKPKVLKEMGISVEPPTSTVTRASDGSRLKYERLFKDWERVIAKARALCSEIYCWAFHLFCNPRVQQELELVHKQHLKQQSILPTGTELTPFTAQVLIDHVQKNYTTDNVEHIKNLERQFETVLRFRGEALIDWLDRITGLVDELKLAREGQDPWDDEEEQELWKRTFVGNITTHEALVLTPQISISVDTDDQDRVNKYQSGIFDPMLFRDVCLRAVHNLPRFVEPDAKVMAFNKARYEKRAMVGVPTPTPNYTNPKNRGQRGNAEDRTSSSNKQSSQYLTEKRSSSKRPRDMSSQDNRRNSKNPKKSVPLDKSCTNTGCINRGTNRNHTNEQCHYRNRPNTGTKRSRGNDTPIRSRNINSKNTSRMKADLSQIECWNCNKKGHYAADCKQPKNMNRFEKHPSFRNLLASTFPDPDMHEAANLVIDSMRGSCCHNCGSRSCPGNGLCDPRNRDTHDRIPEVMKCIRDNPELHDIIMEANEPYQGTAVHAPLTVENYFALRPESPEETSFEDYDEGFLEGFLANNYFNTGEEEQLSSSAPVEGSEEATPQFCGDVNVSTDEVGFEEPTELDDM